MRAIVVLVAWLAVAGCEKVATTIQEVDLSDEGPVQQSEQSREGRESERGQSRDWVQGHDGGKVYLQVSYDCEEPSYRYVRFESPAAEVYYRGSREFPILPIDSIPLELKDALESSGNKELLTVVTLGVPR